MMETILFIYNRIPTLPNLYNVYNTIGMAMLSTLLGANPSTDAAVSAYKHKEENLISGPKGIAIDENT